MLTTLTDAPARSHREPVAPTAPDPISNGDERRLGARTAPATSGSTVAVGLPWPGPGRPCTAAEERRFVARLVDRAQSTSHELDLDAADWTRRDVTAVVTALRCGLDADELLRRAPGLVPGRLVAAHRAVEVRRRDAERAWMSIVADPTHRSLDEHRARVDAILPVVIARLDDQARHGAAHLVAAVDAAAARVEQLGRVAHAVETWLAEERRTPAPMHDGAATTVLHDLDRPGVWDHDHFLPPRVGTLVPSRLAALLGERPTVAR